MGDEFLGWPWKGQTTTDAWPCSAPAQAHSTDTSAPGGDAANQTCPGERTDPGPELSSFLGRSLVDLAESDEGVDSVADFYWARG